MPYTKDNPPEAIKGLPAHAQEIFIAAYNAASKEYEGDEAKSNATAWAAVKNSYEKNDKDEWVAKESYPKEAYAYAPGDESTWKLRLWEGGKLSKVQLGYAAASLSPGGLAGKRIDIKESELPEVKRNIRAGFRTLGVPDEDIPKWVKETESRTLLTGYIPLTEAKVDKGTAKITVIQAGFNSSKDRFYPVDMLTRDHKVFEGVKMYADHPSESDETNRPERSIRDWVATLKNVHMENNAVVGEAVIVEPWMQEKLATLRDKGMLADMGVSINAVGAATQATIEGAKTNYIEKITRGRSVDFVTEAGAGGLVEMYEAERDVDVDFITLTTLRERRPDLVKEIETVVKNTITKEAKKQMELETEIKTLQETNETLTKERDDLKAEKESAVKAKLIAETKAIIEEAIGKAELPEAAKARILERFKDAEKSDGLVEAIKAEQDYIAAITESGKVKGMGGGSPDIKANKDALKESWKRMHPEWTEAQLETAIRGR
jgi:cation transport regulator ChaB